MNIGCYRQQCWSDHILVAVGLRVAGPNGEFLVMLHWAQHLIVSEKFGARFKAVGLTYSSIKTNQTNVFDRLSLVGDEL